MNPEHDQLASAYLDGELTLDERRIAEADPAVMAAVSELRVLRAALADVPAPAADVRDRAIDAAMEVFRAAAARPAITEPARRRHALRQRPRYERWLAVAAAVLVVGLLGVVVATGLRPGGDDDAAVDTATAKTEAPAEEQAVATAEAPVAEAPVAEAATAATMAAADTALEAAAEVADATAEAPAEEPAEDAVEASDDAIDAIDASVFFTFDTAPDATKPIETIDQLAAAGAYLEWVGAEGRLGATPNTACGPALARAEAIAEGTIVAVLVIVTDDRMVTAVTDECVIVLEAAMQP